MANTIRDYSATAASNTVVDGADISEGCSPAGINDAIRGVMADLKDVSTGAVALESPAADSLSVTGDLTVDTNTLYVDSTNNRVGVGTASPVRDFVVQSPSGQAADLSIRTGDTTSSAVIHFGDSDADNQGQIVYQNSDDSMVFNTSTGLGIKLTSSGSVGIGTSSPVASSLLTLKETNAGGDGAELRLINSSTTVESATQIVFTNTTTDTADSAVIKAVRTASGQDFRFSSDGTERFRINSNGSLTATASLTYPSGNGPAWGATYITGHSSSHFINFFTNATERLRIDSSGRVTMPYQPAFFASGGAGAFNSSGIFLGDSSAAQKTNVGGHYSYSTGRFTAPVAGVYMFSYLLTSNDTSVHMVNIHINGADNLQPVLKYYTQYDSATNVVIFTLAANDYVEAHLRASSGYGYYGARFCGHLIG